MDCLDKAIVKINSYLEQNESMNQYEKGWLQQFCARTAYVLRDKVTFEEYQK